MKIKSRKTLHTLFIPLGIGVMFITVFALLSQSTNFSLFTKAENYNPKIVPSNFTTKITNKYFTLPPGKKMVYEKDTEDGVERVEIIITDKTKKIMGLKTIVYWDRVWLDVNNDGNFETEELIEDTRDYLAQDKEGNVWYFGEDVDNYEDGVLIDHDGSWLAGKDGAKAGIWMKANPKKGDSYRQEYYKGEAEDMAKVISTTKTVKTPFGTFKNCLQTYDWTPLDPDSREHKYYCPQVGGMAMEVDLTSDGKLMLVDVQTSEDNESDEDDDD